MVQPFRLSVFLCGIAILLSCGKKESDRIVARAEDRIVTESAFTRSYLPLLLKTPITVQDTEEFRHQHLRNLVTRFYLEEEAKKAGLDTLAGFRRAFAAESSAVIIQGLYQHQIASRLDTISETTLRQAYRRMHTRVHLRHLVSSSRSGIDSLYSRLQAGETFQELARISFRDSTLRQNGGDLGVVSWGDLDIDIEDVAYGLNVQEISEPFETKYGWHILKKENETVNPIMQEQDYLMRRRALRDRIRFRLAKNQADWQIKRMMEPLEIRMNLPLIQELERRRALLMPGHPMSWQSPGELPDLSMPDYLMKIRNEVIAVYQGGEWTVEDFLRYLPTVNPASLQKGIYAAVAMSLRNSFLLQQAEKERIDCDPEVREQLNEKRRHLLSALYTERYADTVRFGEADYRLFYESNIQRFLVDKKMRVLEIRMSDEKAIYRVREQIENESDFRRLASNLNIDPELRKRGGNRGVIYRADDAGEWAFQTPVARPGGPYPLPGGDWSLLWVTEADPIYQPFDNVYQEIKQEMETNKKRWAFDRLVRKYAFGPQVEIDYTWLKTSNVH